jgi:hypothetical protein
MLSLGIFPNEEILGPAFVADLAVRPGPLDMGLAAIAKFDLGTRTAKRACKQEHMR